MVGNKVKQKEITVNGFIGIVCTVNMRKVCYQEEIP
jgi:hypothetical protein